jgi:hypothetical protein
VAPGESTILPADSCSPRWEVRGPSRDGMQTGSEPPQRARPHGACHDASGDRSAPPAVRYRGRATGGRGGRPIGGDVRLFLRTRDRRRGTSLRRSGVRTSPTGVPTSPSDGRTSAVSVGRPPPPVGRPGVPVGRPRRMVARPPFPGDVPGRRSDVPEEWSLARRFRGTSPAAVRTSPSDGRSARRFRETSPAAGRTSRRNGPQYRRSVCSTAGPSAVPPVVQMDRAVIPSAPRSSARRSCTRGSLSRSAPRSPGSRRRRGPARSPRP